jgi:hypothetical protein
LHENAPELRVQSAALQVAAALHDKTAAKGATSKSEEVAGLRSNEVDCKHARAFGKLEQGQWYSDTFTFDFAGCQPLSAVAKAKAAAYSL